MKDPKVAIHIVNETSKKRTSSLQWTLLLDLFFGTSTVSVLAFFPLFSYKYDWKLEEAQKNLLRTHTTAVSARMLYKLGQEEKFHPVKYFSIDRVFRNETLDATHLAEFHQIEGVVADYDLTLGDLMGMLNEFFLKMGKDHYNESIFFRGHCSDQPFSSFQ